MNQEPVLKNLAVIPARSGSKGLKHKNIKKLGGIPLMGHTIAAAKESGQFACVHLSTDSSEYAQIGKELGADVSFLREPELSSDHAGSWEVVRWVVKQFQERGMYFDTAALLQPTSPLRTADDITAAYRLFREKKANMVVSVCEMEHSPLWSNTLPADLSMENFEDPALSDTPRQELPVYYRMNGAVYIADTEFLFSGKPIYGKRSFAYLMDQKRSMDIDSEWDFLMAETVLKAGAELK
ncbi:N-acylneuraminate cytidylyltransferase [Lachnospiraceae bacterium]|nr:N-acylneuraminate cytidylyltransferase [Lachnospiraceae bacterium]